MQKSQDQIKKGSITIKYKTESELETLLNYLVQ